MLIVYTVRMANTSCFLAAICAETLPQITHEQLRFIEKIEKCYYIDNKDQLRDRHTGQIVKL